MRKTLPYKPSHFLSRPMHFVFVCTKLWFYLSYKSNMMQTVALLKQAASMYFSFIKAISLCTMHLPEGGIVYLFSRSLFQSLRSLLGEELAEFLESEERERRLEDVRSRIRLLRDIRMDTRARGMWARLLNDQPAPRKHKSGNKKGGATSRSGCFGHKMDRIGTISGMGC